MMKYKEVYENGIKELEAAEIVDAAIDARILLEFVCETNRNTLFLEPEREVTKEQFTQYQEKLCKRKEHIPLQYITGVQNFMGLDFTVNENVLIPRYDTECLVETVMQHLHDGMSVLDMCTGSGCILLSLLHYSNDCKGLGVDISSAALAVAKKNAMSLEIQADFVESNLFEKVTGKFDIIVSNPPYIRSDVISTLMPEVKEHEPMLALDGTADGLLFYREIAKKAPDYLDRGGQLFFEIGFDQAEAVCAILESLGYTDITVQKDLAGLNRIVFATWIERNKE